MIKKSKLKRIFLSLFLSGAISPGMASDEISEKKIGENKKNNIDIIDIKETETKKIKGNRDSHRFYAGGNPLLLT